MQSLLQNRVEVGRQSVEVRQPVAAHGDGPLGVGPKREARRPEISTFLLQSAGVSQHQARIFRQLQRVVITDGVKNLGAL